ncbi:MAG: YggS family pyridoxal phosphate-dependent enzyme [Halanaerobiales bacterium]|nr:YggS family pyridoxal phosphate-dependent enzyme [Halanaerobiales bacterium]
MSSLIKEKLDNVYKKVKIHCKEVNREPKDVKLVAVAKNHPPKKIIRALKAGQIMFGENRVQELLEKNELFFDQDIKWHFIGHLQKNKVKYLMKIKQLEMIESIDSLEIAQEVNNEAYKNNKTIKVLLQVNIAKDSKKYGFTEESLQDALKTINEFKNIDVKGLMTITPYKNNPEDVRKYYKDMKILLDKLNKKGYELEELSMGMSNDYHIAVQEGATIIRVGTAIFGQRKYY